MQGLAQEVTALRPELVNGEATVGELAWGWAKDFDALSQFWRYRSWSADGQLAAWAWVYLPYQIPRTDGKFLEVKAANLIWQTHPDRPELLAEILDWYDDVGDVDRLLTVQVADVQARAIVAAHGYAFDSETGWTTGPGTNSMHGSWPTWRIRCCRRVSGFWRPRTCRWRTRSGRIGTRGIRPVSPRRRSSGSGGPGRTGPICMC